MGLNSSVDASFSGSAAVTAMRHAKFARDYRYPRALLAARRAGALWASCLRCFWETFSADDVFRPGTDGLVLKLDLYFSLRILRILHLRVEFISVNERVQSRR